jgi:hypothetical protein
LLAAQAGHITEIGAGEVQRQDREIRLSIPPSSSQRYHDAQISDYDTPTRFGNRPPLRLSLEARAQGAIRGTAGFGFWNHAFEPGSRRLRPPQALWFFFGSPPHDIALAKSVAGHGWKAAAINARRWQFYALLPLALPGFLLMRSRRLYDTLWPIGQRALAVSETLLAPALLNDFRAYTIEWHPDHAVFAVDGDIVLRARIEIARPLGFIAWVDNQYAIATPQGRFGWGLLDVPQTQALILRDLQISNLP